MTVGTLMYVPNFLIGPMLTHTQPAVEFAVTRLLVAIKQLLESLTSGETFRCPSPKSAMSMCVWEVTSTQL